MVALSSSTLSQSVARLAHLWLFRAVLSSPRVLFSLASPADNARGPVYMEHAFSTLHQANRRRLPLILEYGRHAHRVGLYLRCPGALKGLVRNTLLAHYPDCKLTPLPDHALDPPDGYHSFHRHVRLRPDLFPLRWRKEFEDVLEHNLADPLSGILATLSCPPKDALWCKVQLHLTPASPRARGHARKVIRRLRQPFFTRHPLFSELYATAACSWWQSPLAWLLAAVAAAAPSRTPPDRPADVLAEATSKIDRHLYHVSLRLAAAAPDGAERRARRKLDELIGAFGQFAVPGRSRFRPSRIRSRTPRRTFRRRQRFLLSDAELAVLYHPATETVRTERMAINVWREMEPPARIASGKGTDEALLGKVKFRSRGERFAIQLDDRRRHVAVVGKTGMGKSTLLQNLIVSDIRAGRGVGLIDPHGDLAEAVLGLVPPPRTNEVILLDAGDTAFPVAFNPLACSDPMERPLVVSGVMSAFKKLYGDSWGPRLEHILRNALLALVAVPGTSLLSLLRLLSDASYRRAIVEQVDDPVVRSFWHQEFAGWNDRFRSEAISPVQNKLGHFLSSPVPRAIIGQAKSTINLRRAMNAGQILIVNLSKGRIGEDTSALLGSLLVTSLQQAAMSRADTPENDRRDFFLYVDEFQNFATESFATILSEARKYRLSLTIANQYLSQMDEGTSDAVFGNVGSLVCFQVGPQDADILAEQLGGDLNANDLVALPRFTAYVRLLVEGMPSRPFSMETLSPSTMRRHAGRSDIVRRTSRHRYARPASQVEAEIERAFTFH